MRSSVNGRAKGTDILFLHSEASLIGRRIEQEVFPGIKVELSNIEVPTAEHQREVRSLKVVNYLRSLDKDKISTKELKQQVEFYNLSKDQWKTIADIVEDSLLFEWERSGRSWSRSEDYSLGLMNQDKINYEIVV